MSPVRTAVMATTTQDHAERPVVTDHLSVRPDGAGPPEVHFLFEQQQKRIGGALGASVVAHGVFLAVILLLIRALPDRFGEAVLPERTSDEIVWIAEVGQTTTDGKFTLMHTECLGSCGTAPVCQINDDYHENFDEKQLDKVLGEFR